MGYELTPVGIKQSNGYQSAYFTISESKLHKLANEAGTREIKIKVQAYSPGKTVTTAGKVEGHMIYKASGTQDIYEKETTTINTKKTSITGGGPIRRDWKLRGSFIIRKVDEFTGKTGNTVTDLSGIKFNVKKGTTNIGTYETDSDGYTSEIANLEAGTYTIYETYIPDRFKNIYDKTEKESSSKSYTITIGNGDFYDGKTLNIKKVENDRDFTNIEIIKKDKITGEVLEGIPIRVLDVTTTSNRRWINSTGGKIYDSESQWENGELNKFEKPHTFYTNDKGKVIIKNIPVGRNLVIYETDEFKDEYKGYKNIYDINSSIGTNTNVKQIHQLNTSNCVEADGTYTIPIDNPQNFGTLQINKRETNTKVPLAGIGFKIKVTVLQKNGASWGNPITRWVKLTRNSSVTIPDNMYNATSVNAINRYIFDFSSLENTSYNDATVVYTKNDGAVPSIEKLPLTYLTPNGENYSEDRTFTYNKKQYRIVGYTVYEVYIPTESENKKNLRKYFSLSNTALVYDARNDSNKKKLVSDEGFKLNDGIIKNTTQPRVKAEVTYPSSNIDGYLNNDQKYISISGKVWEDGRQGKNNKVINNVYDSQDYLIQNVNVRLVDVQNNIVTYVNEEGNIIPQIKSTNEKGEYTFDYVDMNSVSTYHIEFSYDGITYQAVEANTSDTITQGIPGTTNKVTVPAPYTSKASETDQRDKLNNVFTELTGDGQKLKEGYPVRNISFTYKTNGLSGAKVVTENINGKLEYEKDGDIAKMKNTAAYNWDRDDANKKVKINTQGQFQLTASISNGYLATSYYNMIMKKNSYTNNKKELLTEIPNMNLGLYQRTQPNLALSKDTYSAEVEVNDKKFTYKYAQKMDAQVQSLISDGEDYMRNVPTILGTAFERKNPLSEDLKYKTPVYKADMQYIEPTNSDRELKVSIIYAIGLVNDSAYLSGKINSIKEYFSEDMDIIGIYEDNACTTELQGAKIENQSTHTGTLPNVSESKTYKTANINLKDTNIILDAKTTTGGNHVKYIYIKMSLPKTSFYDIANGTFNADKEYMNHAEISSYTSYYAPGKTYAHFDYTSIPNNSVTLLGDVNGDNNVNVADSLILRQYLADLNVSINTQAADVNKDGVINQQDVTEIRQYLARWENTYGIGNIYSGIREDDDDHAPGLKLELAEERTISGVVFEDESLPDNGLNCLIGDGIKGMTENGVKGVVVQLVPLDLIGKGPNRIEETLPEEFSKVGDIPLKEDVEDYYKRRNLNKEDNILTVRTNEKGEFTIKGYIPGDYQIRYIRDNMIGNRVSINGKEIDALEYKSTIYKTEQTNNTNSKNWYLNSNQGTNYSEAVDTWENRIKVDKKLKINYDDLKVNPNIIGSLGDVDSNGNVESIDVTTLRQYIARWGIKIEEEISDVNKDGEINIIDVLIIQGYLGGNENVYGISGFYSSIPYDSEDEYMLNSWTRVMDLGVELRGEEGLDYVIVGDTSKYAYNISSIDLGLIERPKQQLEVTKELKKIRVIDGQDRVVVEAEIVEENGKKVLKNADEVKYAVYLPSSDANASGTLKTELDKDYLPARLEAQYCITVKNSGQADYENETFYYYGPVENNNEWRKNPVKIQPTGVYDYISEQCDIDGTGYEVVTKEEYSKEVHNRIDSKILKPDEENIEQTKTVIEYGYTQEGTSVLGSSWKSTYKTLASLYEEWNEKVYGTTTTRVQKLNGRKILELTALEHGYEGGEKAEYTYTATSTITSEGQDIPLYNDIEIINTQREGEYGRTKIPTYKTLYDSGESIIVTPPTGENRDTTESNTWIIIASSALAALGVGIVLLKKFLKKTK